MQFNTRLIGTPLAAPSIPSFAKPPLLVYGLPSQESKACEKDTTILTRPLKSKRQYITRRILVLLGRYIALCVFYDPDVSLYLFQHQGSWSPADFAPDKRGFLRRLLRLSQFRSFPISPITRREVLTRTHLVLDWVISDWLTLSSYHDILAIIAVGTNLDGPDPEEWPPLFGNISEATTVRRFWSNFWHQLVYRSFGGYASLFSEKVLRLRRGSLVARYVNNGLVFFLSGLMHALVDWKLDESKCGYWGIAGWYWMQVVAIVAEEVAQSVWIMFEKQLPLGKTQYFLLTCGKRVVGYIWVMGWFFWSMPLMFFDQYYCLAINSQVKSQ